MQKHSFPFILTRMMTLAQGLLEGQSPYVDHLLEVFLHLIIQSRWNSPVTFLDQFSPSFRVMSCFTVEVCPKSRLSFAKTSAYSAKSHFLLISGVPFGTPQEIVLFKDIMFWGWNSWFQWQGHGGQLDHLFFQEIWSHQTSWPLTSPSDHSEGGPGLLV